MREETEDVSTLNVSVRVYTSFAESTELAALLRTANGLQAEEQASFYCSKGPSGGVFPYVKITGAITAIASALAAYFEGRKKKCFVDAQVGKTSVVLENYTAKEVLRILRQAKALEIKDAQDDLSTFGMPEETAEKHIEGFAAKRQAKQSPEAENPPAN